MQQSVQKIIFRAYSVAQSIHLQGFRERFANKLMLPGNSELYYQGSDNRYLLVLNYGVVVFGNYTDKDSSDMLLEILPFANKPAEQKKFSDNFSVEFVDDPGLIEISFDALTLGRYDNEVIKAIMLNLGQSVCLDRYAEQGQNILGELKNSTEILGKSGKIRVSQKEALRLAGLALETKNGIAENLYILDEPDITWEDEFIHQLYKTLSTHFDLFKRYRALENTLKIVDDNLQLYIAYNQHRESSRLEWIIIILIVIEVIDTILSKLI